MIRIYMIAGLAFTLLAGFFGLRMYYINLGKTKCETTIVYKELEIREKRNEIANNRPDDVLFFDGLLNDPEW